MKKADRIAKCTSKFITGVVMAFGFMIFCPLFSSNVSASSAETVVSFPATNRNVKFDSGSANSTNYRDFNGVTVKLPLYTFEQFTAQSGSVVLQYDAFDLSFVMGGFKYTGSTFYPVTDSSNLVTDFGLYLSVVRNRDTVNPEYYPLNTSGGYIALENTSSITSYGLSVNGNVNGRAVYSTANIYYGGVNVTASALDFYISDNTIVDSEGTVWIVPAGVNDPVIVSIGSGYKYLFDASNLKYITTDRGKYPVSLDVKTVTFYKQDGSSTDFTFDVLNQNYIVPFYLTSFSFDDFLYGSLPELQLEQKPDPTPTPAPDDRFEQLDVVVSEVESYANPYNPIYSYDASSYEPENNWFTTWQTVGRSFSIFSSKQTTESLDPDFNLYHAHYDEFVSYPLTVFVAPPAHYDGYCVISFPQGYGFKEKEGGCELTGSGAESIVSGHYIVEVIPYLLVQGVRYEISPFGCQFTFQVYEDEAFSFLIGYEAHIRADVVTSEIGTGQWEFQYDVYDYTTSIWYYTDDNELSQIKDMLQNFPGADKMDEDISNLDGAMKDYDDVNNSIFESAGEGLGNFDITTGLQFNGKLLSAIALLSTVISKIILAMGDYSILYTVGACLLLACILFGLFKYYGGDDK